MATQNMSCFITTEKRDELAKFKWNLYSAKLEKPSLFSYYALHIFYANKRQVLIMCLLPKSVVICQGEELFSWAWWRAPLIVEILRRGMRGEWSRRIQPKKGGRIIVGNSFHFIKSWSPRRQGHSDERWERGREGEMEEEGGQLRN